MWLTSGQYEGSQVPTGVLEGGRAVIYSFVNRNRADRLLVVFTFLIIYVTLQTFYDKHELLSKCENFKHRA